MNLFSAVHWWGKASITYCTLLMYTMFFRFLAKIKAET